MRLAVILFGIALSLFGVVDLVSPRAKFLNSNPPPRAIVAEPPTSVILNFSKPLAPESTMDVTSTIKLLPAGELEYLDGRSVITRAHIDARIPAGSRCAQTCVPDFIKAFSG